MRKIVCLLILLLTGTFVFAQQGAVWFVPASLAVNAGDLFQLEIHVNTGSKDLMICGLDFRFDGSYLDYIGHALGANGRSVTYTLDRSLDGYASIGDQGTSDYRVIPAGTDLHIATVTFKAMASGNKTISLGVNNLRDAAGAVIGTPTGDSIAITIAGSVGPRPTPASTLVPTPTPYIGVPPQNPAPGNYMRSKLFRVTQYGAGILPNALVEIQALTVNAAYTNQNGECTLVIYANDADTVNAKITYPALQNVIKTYPATDTAPLDILMPCPSCDPTNTPTRSPTASRTTTATGSRLPTTTATPRIKGDVNDNGTVDIVDALMVAQYYVGLMPSGFLISAADVNCDGAITIVDALIIAQYYVGLVTQFC